MTPYRAPPSFACVALLLTATSAAASPVVVARLEAPGADAALAGRLDASLREEARRVVGDRLLSAAPARPAGCANDQACAATLASAHSAAFVVLSSYEARGDRHALRVRLHDGSGTVTTTAERSLGAPPDGRVLRGALAELLNPSTYVGRLRLTNVPSDAQVTVDKLPLSRADVVQPYALSVGAHVVEVRAPERAPLVREVQVAYDEEVSLDGTLSPLAGGEVEDTAVGPVVAARVPWWPAAISGTVTVAATTAAVIAGIDWAATDAEVRGKIAAAVNSTAQSEANQYAGSTLPRKADEGRLPLLRAAIRTDMVIVTVASSVAVIAALATGAFVARWATAEEPNEAIEETP